MPIYAVINNGIVANSIIADSLEIAEEVTGLTCVLGDYPLYSPYDPDTNTVTLLIEPTVEQPAE